MKGYEALRGGAAWLDVSARGKIKLTGEDRARLLHALTTNHVQELLPGSGCYAFFLTVQGRILSDVNVLCRPDHLLLDLEPETREKVYQHLEHYIIADDVTLEDTTAQTATIAVEGPRSAAVIEVIGAPVPKGDYASAEWGTRLVARLSTTGSLGFFVMAPCAEAAQVIAQIEAAGAVAGDDEAFRVVRLEHGRPRYGEDLSERYLAQEANLPQALHFNKGCYLGQEIVERVRSRGQIHRVLMPLKLETKEAPAAGAKLTVGDAPAAEITSAAYSPALGGVVALAYVRTDYAKPGTKMMLDDVVVEVCAGGSAG